jgi:dTDP-3-amino-2,3,6-trideoxy-4-keto-D-glucose/dTDP-3-amino-3,4,6-trideoxy-alpha-D-glucose/dTDP-2,6-dideoxy-D-kanosamine transaminase
VPWRTWTDQCESLPGKRATWAQLPLDAFVFGVVCDYLRSFGMNRSQIPLNDPVRHVEPIKARLNQTIQDVVWSGRFLSGPKTAGFQEAFARYCGADFCLGVGNATDGLELALRAIGARNQEVITTANAGGYVTTACRLIDATPVYVDVLGHSLVMDPSGIEQALSPLTAAVVVTHLFGNVVDVPAIRAVLSRLGRDDVAVIEDASQAHGGGFFGKSVGGLGDLSVFSFYPTKNLGAFGDAGAVLTSDGGVIERLRALHQYGWSGRYQSQTPFGRNSRIDELQAAVLLTKLDYLDEWVDERRRIVGRISRSLVDSPLRLVTDHLEEGAAHLAVVRTRSRDALTEHLNSVGIDVAVHYPILDMDQVSQQGLSMRTHPIPETVEARDEILSVPCFPGLAPAELDRIADALESFQEEPE